MIALMQFTQGIRPYALYRYGAQAALDTAGKVGDAVDSVTPKLGSATESALDDVGSSVSGGCPHRPKTRAVKKGFAMMAQFSYSSP